MGHRLYSIASVFALVVAAYLLSGLSGFFLFDDYPSIAHNQAVTFFDPGSLRSWGLATFGAPETLRPVSYLSFAFQWWLSPDNAAAMRVVNVLIHAGAGVFVHLGLREGLCLFRRRPERADERLALLGALLWALHPIQTQPVNYVVQRMTLLAGLFCLISLWFYLRARRTGEVLKRESQLAEQARMMTCSVFYTNPCESLVLPGVPTQSPFLFPS